MHCIDLTSKRSKKLSYVPKLQKQSNSYQFASIWRQNDQKCWDTSQNILNNAKLQNWSNYNELHRFDVKTVKNRKTTKGIKLRSICIDLTSKRSKMLSNVSKHSKQRKTTKLIKLQWIASIWCQNGQKSQNYERDQIIMHCIDLTSKRSKKLNAKLQKQSNSYQFASIWRQNDQKCWVTSQNILNNAKLQKWSNYNELHRFDVKTVKNRKTTKAIKLRSICIDLTSKRSKMLSYVAKHSKQRKTTKLIKLQWIASIWCQNDQKSQNYKSNQIPINLHRFEVKTIKMLRYVAKLQKWSNYNELHWFDVKTFKTFELGRKTTKVIKLQWSASIWHQNNQKCRVTS